MALSEQLRNEGATEPRPAQEESATPRLLARVLPELATLGLVVVLWPMTSSLESSAGGPGPAFVPRVLLGLLLVSALVGLLLELRRSRRGRPAPTPASAASDGAEEETDVRRALVAAALVLGYVAATAVLGWVLASTVFAVVFLWLSGHRRPLTLLGVALVAPQVLAYVFVKVVYIALPTGLGIFDTITVALYELFGIY